MESPATSLPFEPKCPTCLDDKVVYGDQGKLQDCPACSSEIHLLRRRKYAELPTEVRTFANLAPRPDIKGFKEAVVYCKGFAKGVGNRPWLMLKGMNGVGKTHLAQAIIADRIERINLPAGKYLDMKALLRRLKMGFKAEPESTEAITEEAFDLLLKVPLLALNDIGAVQGTAWAQQKLIEILEYRYDNAMPTVITMDLMLQEYERMFHRRIRDRLEDKRLVATFALEGASYRQQP